MHYIFIIQRHYGVFLFKMYYFDYKSICLKMRGKTMNNFQMNIVLYIQLDFLSLNPKKISCFSQKYVMDAVHFIHRNKYHLKIY